MMPTLTLTQVMFFRDARSMVQLNAMVLAIFQELESFFAPTGSYAHVERLRMLSKVQGDLMAPSTVEVVREILSRAFSKAPNQARTPDVEASEQSWAEAKGRFRNTVDPDKLIAIVKRQLPEPIGHDRGRLLIVTDQEITPPPQWRYKMRAGDDQQHAVVVSLAPMNPRSWSSEQDDRDLTVLKHRIRAACIRKLAMWCGLQECDQENCYLFRHVESAESLDYFTHLGGEHVSEASDFAPVVELEFNPSSDPAQIQDLRKRPMEAGSYA
jgi:hypothetical protein